MDPRSTSSNMSATDSITRESSYALPDAAAFGSALIKQEPRSSVEERKAKKREQDRMCQRRKREKDKENLRRLEARLNGLQTANESKTVLDLLLQREQDQAKIDRQADRLRQLQSLLQAGLSDLANDDSSPSPSANSKMPQQDAQDIKVGNAVPNMIGPVAKPSAAPGLAAPMPISTYYSTPITDGHSDIKSARAVAFRADSVYDPPDDTDEPSMPSEPWMIAGRMIESACQTALQISSVATAEAVDQHIILTAWLHGWEVASASFVLDHPAWACLRQVDEAIISTWTTIERLVGLYSMWRVFKAKAEGPQAVAQMTPRFFRPRPSQLNIPHRPDIDYWPWPGVRERIVFNPERYYGDAAFLRDFSTSTHFLWPFAVADLYTEDQQTQLLQFTPEFMKRFYNVNSFSVDSSFLSEWPEFVGDIPTYNSIPPNVVDKEPDEQDFYFDDETMDESFALQVRRKQRLMPNGDVFLARGADH